MVLVEVHSVLLAQLTHFVVELSGDVNVRCGNGTGDAFGPEEAVDLRGGGEDAVAGAGPEDHPHVRPGQVEVTRR